MMNLKRNRLAAMGVSAAIGLSLFTGMVFVSGSPAAPIPTLYIEGLRLQNVPNASGSGSSIQALVDVYAENVDKLNSASLFFQYNSELWVPSDFDTNEAITVDTTARDYFQVDPALYGGDDPFTTSDNAATQLNVDGNRLLLGLAMKSENLLNSTGEKGKVKSAGIYRSNEKYFYIEANDKVKLGTISFRVNPDPDKIATLTSKLDSYSWSWGPAVNFTPVSDPDMPLLLTDDKANTSIQGDPKPWVIGPILDDTQHSGYVMMPQEADNYYYDMNHPSHVEVSLDVPYQVIDVQAVKNPVIVNAYQAYTAGDISDIAATLQRYSPTVRLRYPNGDVKYESIYWGDEELIVQDMNAGVYFKFQYTPGGGYTAVEVDSSGNPVAPSGWTYDPREGVYQVKQYYHYVEDGQNKVYPTPVTVDLTITKVVVTDVTAENLRKSYRSIRAELPTDTDGLELPDEGRLTYVDHNGEPIVLTDSVQTIPLTTWTNRIGTTPPYTTGVTLPVAAANMSTVVEVGGTKTWPVNETTEIDTNAGIGDYNFVCADPTAAAIRGLYPWATVPTDHTVDVLRKILPNTAAPKMEYVASVTGVSAGSGLQTINVQRADGTPMESSLVVPNNFKIYLPDGTYVDPVWFHAPSSIHDTQVNGNGWDIRTAPLTGDPDTTYAAQRAQVRRSINLGGWFTVEVYEPSAVGYWSDPIRVYSPRRQNNYQPKDDSQLDYVFDYTGHDAGKYPFHSNSNLGKTIVLPTGDTVKTTYDGVTGDEPGFVGIFTATNNWDGDGKVGGFNHTGPVTGLQLWDAGEVVTYGHPSPSLYDSYTYGSGYGLVENMFGRTVVMKVEPDGQDPAVVEKLHLTYEHGPDPAHIREKLDDSVMQVDTVVFDTKTARYGSKQVFELTLTNKGTETIHGLYIDPLSGANPTNKQHFIIERQPAYELPAGASTTFTITYDLNLPVGSYRDVMKIFTSEGTVKSFIACFRVVDGKPYKLTVVPRPQNMDMGEGGTVLGVLSGIYSDTPAGNTFMAGDKIWVLATKYDEYDVKKNAGGKYEVFYYDGSGVKQYLDQRVLLPSEGTLGSNELLFTLPGDMPSRDLTIYIDFFEPNESKIRPGDLKAFADPTVDTVTGSTPADNICLTPEEDLYDITDLTYNTIGFNDEKGHENYEVIIGVDDDYCGLEVTLRDLVPYEVSESPYVVNADITPMVHIQLDDLGNTVVLDEPGDTSVPTKHQTVFQAPDPGQRRKATITITYEYTDGGGTHTVTRTPYTVTFIRRTEIPIHTFGYGDTPYGLIMNDPAITDKDGAKAAYDAKDRFGTGFVPAKAADHGFDKFIYWPQAWEQDNLDRDDSALVVYAGEDFIDPGILKLLDSTGRKVNGKVIHRSLTFTLLDTTTLNPDNGVRNDTVIRFDLDSSVAANTETLDLGDLNIVNGVVAPIVETALSDYQVLKDDQMVRPGIYKITYTFEDFDGTVKSFDRPLVILTRPGDVDADAGFGVLEGSLINATADSELIKRRNVLVSGLENGLLAYDDSVGNYSSEDKAVYRYRICDVNNDRHVNNIDANRMRKAEIDNVQLQYYDPMDFGVTVAP